MRRGRRWRPYLRGSIVAWPLAALAVVVVLVVNEAGQRQSLMALDRLRERTVAVATVQKVLRSLLDAESGQRGYLITGRLVYFAPYRRAAADAEAAIGWLRVFYEKAGDGDSRAVLSELQAHARRRLTELDHTVHQAEKKPESRPAALLASEDSRAMAQVRRLADQLTKAQRQAIDRDRAAVQDILRTSRLAVDIASALGVLALLVLLRQTAALDVRRERHKDMMLAEQARLESEVGWRTADLTALTRHLQTVCEDERRKLAADLQGELGNLLMATRIELLQMRSSLEGTAAPELLARIDQMQGHLDAGIALQRRIIEDLCPSALSRLGLASALEILAREFADRSEIQVQTRLQELPLDEAAQLTSYRLVQEALTNAAKYANAGSVRIALQLSDRGADWARLVVEDDGIGFDPGIRPASAHGLLGMRHRVQACGGDLNVRSARGQGTLIEAVLPLRRADQQTPGRPAQAAPMAPSTADASASLAV